MSCKHFVFPPGVCEAIQQQIFHLVIVYLTTIPVLTNYQVVDILYIRVSELFRPLFYFSSFLSLGVSLLL